jgi:deoxyadenosine/deoxycytidine kinase
MYSHPREKSFVLQSHIQFTMFQIQRQKVRSPFKITERSLSSEKFVFIQNLIENNYVSSVESDVLTEWYELLNSMIPPVDEIIYLQTSPQTAFERLRSRQRSEESPVTFEYISQIHELYEKWLMQNNSEMIGHSRLTVLDQNQSLENLHPVLDQIVLRLKDQLPPVTNY